MKRVAPEKRVRGMPSNPDSSRRGSWLRRVVEDRSRLCDPLRHRPRDIGLQAQHCWAVAFPDRSVDEVRKLHSSAGDLNPNEPKLDVFEKNSHFGLAILVVLRKEKGELNSPMLLICTVPKPPDQEMVEEQPGC